MVFKMLAQKWAKLIQEDFLLDTSCVVSVFRSLPPFFQGGILTLYSPSPLILTFHLLVRQVTTWVHVPSAAFPHLLLIVITETILFRGLFPINVTRTFVGAFNAEVTTFPWTDSTLYSRARSTVLLLWGQRICDPGPLYIRAQGLRRGETLSRTCNESPNGLEM